MDKFDFFKDSRYVPNSDLPNLELGSTISIHSMGKI